MKHPPRPILVVPNVTPCESTASIPVTVLYYNGPLLCSFNVSIKWLTQGVVSMSETCNKLFKKVSSMSTT